MAKKNRMEATMTNRSTVLRRKLEELERLLKDVGSAGSLNLYREIEDRFDFAKKLLTAEIQSRRSVQEGEDGGDGEMVYLECMLKRLIELEEDFNRWTGNCLVTEPEMQMTENGGNCFVCSCTEPCLNESGGQQEEEEEEEVGAEEKEEFQYGSSEKAAPDTAVGTSVGQRVLISFGIIGFLLGIVSCLSYFDYHVKNNVFVTPT